MTGSTPRRDARWRLLWAIPVFGGVSILAAVMVHARNPSNPPLDPVLGLILPGLVGLVVGTGVTVPTIVAVGAWQRFLERRQNAVIAVVIDGARTLDEFGETVGLPTESRKPPLQTAIMADEDGISLWRIGLSSITEIVSVQWESIGPITTVQWTKPVGALHQQLGPRFCMRLEIHGRPVSVLAEPIVAGVQLTGGRPDEADMIAFVDRVKAQRPHP